MVNQGCTTLLAEVANAFNCWRSTANISNADAANAVDDPEVCLALRLQPRRCSLRHYELRQVRRL
jgi:hypothetical protein